MSEINTYLNSLPGLEKAELERVRAVIRQAVPEAAEVISYGMPGFKYRGKYLAGYYAFKTHLSLFPAGTVEAFADKLEGYTLSKGTIQFTLDRPLPESLIKEIILYRKAEIDKGILK
jgi:uncharacterized protein YdhG (YjbR/CyaY superfamily)